MEQQLQSTAKTHKLPHLIELSQIPPLAINGIIIGLWFWLYWPLFDYFAVIFAREDFRTNQLVLVGVIVLIALQLRRKHLRLWLDRAPHLFLPALSLLLGGSVLYLISERFLDVNTLSASLFGLASYGLLGLWLPPRPWRQGLPAALLLIGALPFGEHMQTFIGYPLRIFTATLVRDGLAAAGVTSVGVDTILVFENGVSQVDLPCSGVKSLWTGMLFLLAATWLERRPLNLRWLLLALGFTACLIIANFIRVGVLVAAGPVAGWPLLAEMLHVPLGVLGFVAACTAAVWSLRLSPKKQEFRDESFSTLHVQATRPSQPAWLGPALVVAILTMGLVYTPRPQTGSSQSLRSWEFPAGLTTSLMPLKPDEMAWLTRDGAESVERRRFEWRGLTGSMILITSSTWRAHHRPERCFEVYGLSLEDSSTYLVKPSFPVRFVSLGNGAHAGLLSAAYWFQSADHTTDDYGARIWADLAPQRERWVLVSVLFDNVTEPETAQVQTFYLALHEAVAHYLEGGTR